jgi:hypothetical protein
LIHNRIGALAPARVRCPVSSSHGSTSETPNLARPKITACGMPSASAVSTDRTE